MNEIIPMPVIVEGEEYDYRDENNYYFIPSKIYAEVEKLFQQQSMSFPLSKNRIIRQLAVEKISITNGNKNTSVDLVGQVTVLLSYKDQAKTKSIFTQKNNSANVEITTFAELCLVPLTGLEFYHAVFLILINAAQTT